MEWFKRILYALAIVAIGVGGYFSLTSELFEVSSVSIEMMGDSDDKYLFDRIHSDIKNHVTASLLKQSLWFVDLPSVLDKIKDDQRVFTVKGSKKFPSTVVFKLQPRRPIGLLLSSSGEFFPLGQDGELLPELDQGRVSDLPLIRGPLFFKKASLRLEVVKILTGLPSEGLFAVENISEIHRIKGGEYELHLNDPAALVKVSIDDFKYKVSMVIRVLDYLHSHSLKGRVIDARFSKKVVVRLRNQP